MGTTRRIHDTKNKCRFDLDKSCFGDVFEPDRYDLVAARENGALDLLLLNAYRRSHSYQPDGTFDYVQRVAKRLKQFLDKCDWRYELVVDGDLEVEEWGLRQAWPITGTVIDAPSPMRTVALCSPMGEIYGVAQLPLYEGLLDIQEMCRRDYNQRLVEVPFTAMTTIEELTRWVKERNGE